MDSKKLIEAYKFSMRRRAAVCKNISVAEDAIQDTVLRLLTKGIDKKVTPERYRQFFFHTAKWRARDIIRGSRSVDSVFYESELSGSIVDGVFSSVYEIALSERDYGQIESIDNKLLLDDIKEYTGEDHDFVMDHIVFRGGNRTRGATGVPHNQKIYESEAERYRMNYLIKKIRKKYGGALSR